MKLPVSFTQYYNNLKIPKASLESFVKMDLRFTLGIYLDYFTSRGILLTVTTHGFLATVHPLPSLDTPLLFEENFKDETDLILAYSKAIQYTLNYIENPF